MEWADLRATIDDHKISLVMAVVGLGLAGGSLGWWMVAARDEVEVEIVTEAQAGSNVMIWVDVAGAVEKPGVYKLNEGARVKDALLAAGGLEQRADRIFVSRFVNLAQEIKDGAKIYIPMIGDTMTDQGSSEEEDERVVGESSERININSATSSQLQELWGVGEARASQIIEGRPYQSIEELQTKKIVPDNVYEKIKDQISSY